MNCRHSFRTQNKLELCKQVYENKDFCNFVTVQTQNSEGVLAFWRQSSEDEDAKKLEFSQFQNFDKAPLIIYVDLECLIEKILSFKSTELRILKNKTLKEDDFVQIEKRWSY